MANAKLLMLVGDYVEDYEVMVPFQALQMVGHTVHAVCPDKKAGQFVRTAIHDFEGDQTYTEKRGHNFTLNATFADIQPRTTTPSSSPAAARPNTSASIPKSSTSFATSAEADKPIAALCHGAATPRRRARHLRQARKRLSSLRPRRRARRRHLRRRSR